MQREAFAPNLTDNRRPKRQTHRLVNTSQRFESTGGTHHCRCRANGEAVRPSIPLGVEDYRQAPVSGTTLVFRGDAGPDAITSVRGQIASIDSNLTIFNVRSMREQMDEMFSLIVFSEAIYGGIGIFGLILASVGLAGVTGYAVARRHKEIGIRMALGARSTQVLALVLKEGTVLVAVGSVLGFAGAFAISRGLSSVTSQFASAFASSVGDPILLIGAPVLLASLAMLACYVPARRSTKIDPLQALREE
jgi:putative ABC transport system permease protein